jgi:hypothetical protein
VALPAVDLTSLIEPRESAHLCNPMISALVDHYRCPEDLLRFALAGTLSSGTGYYCFGHDTICYGRSAAGYRTIKADALLYDVLPHLQTTCSTVHLPFNPTEVIDNLRQETYARRCQPSSWNWRQRFLRDAYYFARPWMKVGLRKHLQQVYQKGWRSIAFPKWPVDTTVERLSERLLLASMKAQGIDRIPFVWFWPHGAKGCVLMTHDVEDQKGYDFCRQLMDLDDDHGMKASIQLVPEGSYKVSEALVQEIRDRGFEVNVQDLNHDGFLFVDKQEFLRRVKKINEYGRAYGATGFRAAILYRNLDWYDALEFSYDMSVPNVAHLDPQRGGCCTVMPYFVGGILEIPVTTTQDYMLFHLLGDYSLDLWKTQTEAILEKNGLISFLIHPDYVTEQRALEVYGELLCWLRDLIARESLWAALPGEVDAWWRARSKMRVVCSGGKWRVKGPGAERAVLAFAKIVDDHIEYEVDSGLKIIAGHTGTRVATVTQ